MKVKVIDVGFENGDRVTLTATPSGGLRIQTFRERGNGRKPCYERIGESVLPSPLVRDWAATLVSLALLAGGERGKHSAAPRGRQPR